jgi:hypothetical protein
VFAEGAEPQINSGRRQATVAGTMPEQGPVEGWHVRCCLLLCAVWICWLRNSFMKRSGSELQPSDLGRKWSGLSVRPKAGPTQPATPGTTQRLVDAGIACPSNELCLGCGAVIASKSERSTICAFCRLGPFHLSCVLQRVCEMAPASASPTLPHPVRGGGRERNWERAGDTGGYVRPSKPVSKRLRR